MKLKRLTITNCSRIKDLDIDVRENLVLIGPNGSGKTTVLQCLEMLLGMSKQRLYGTVTKDFVLDYSLPFSVQASFSNLTPDELAAFPDEVDAQKECELKIRLDVTVDEGGDGISGAWSFPYSGTSRAPSRVQRDAFGWTLLQAQANPGDVRQDRKSIIDDVISEIDLGADEEGISDVVNQMIAILAKSGSLESVREKLASHLSQALPNGLTKEDLEFVPGATLDEDLMGDVRFRINGDGHMRLAREHSDGTKALFAMAIHDLLHRDANIFAIDEPEAHLHPSSQRSLAKMLKEGPSQKILVTHSPTIAGSFEPDEIVVIRADGQAVQPEEGFLRDDAGMLARWWIGRQLEPLTAGIVIAVEGPSDRIIVNQVAKSLGLDLDRHDVVVIETDGCGDMKAIEAVFGKEGFDIPLFVLVDEDARKDTAKRFGADPDNPADLEEHGVFVSFKDLEDEYVQAIGPEKLWGKMRAAKTLPENVFNQCVVGLDGNPSACDLAAFIRAKSKRKIPTALIAASLIDGSNARRVESVARLLEAMSV